jgi:hypothetical protein
MLLSISSQYALELKQQLKASAFKQGKITMTIKKKVSKAKRNAKRQTATFKAAYKRNAMSNKKANNTMGSRRSVLGAMTNALSKTHTSGRLGAKAGVAHRKTAAKIGKMKKSVYKMTASHKAAISRALKGKRK